MNGYELPKLKKFKKNKLPGGIKKVVNFRNSRIRWTAKELISKTDIDIYQRKRVVGNDKGIP